MPVIIGSARIDENGNEHSGKAGDQTGHEVETQEWYLHPYGWIVIRPKSKAVADLIAADMEYACDNNMVGYDQWQHLTLYNEAKKYGFNIRFVNVPVETHCASLIRVCIAYAGTVEHITVLINCPEFYTGNEVSVLSSTGEFDILRDPKHCESCDFLRRGDILVTQKKGHTVVVLTNGGEEDDDLEPIGAYKTTGAVYIRKGPGTQYKDLGVIPKGAVVDVHSISDGWARCTYNNVSGYASMKYLTEIDRRYVTTGNVWMRKSPGVVGFPIMVIKRDSFVLATGRSASVLGTPWYEVIYDGKTGWCSSKLLKKC